MSFEGAKLFIQQRWVPSSKSELPVFLTVIREFQQNSETCMTQLLRYKYMHMIYMPNTCALSYFVLFERPLTNEFSMN